VTALALSGAAPALASGGRTERNSGSCGSATWKLKAKADDGRLEVEFELDTNHNGQAWRVRVFDNGNRVVKARQTTSAPSGSFSLERRIANRAGTDNIVVRARKIGTDRVCSGTVNF
jgi:hypothetical protein